MVKRIYNIVLQSAIGDGATPSTEIFFMTGRNYQMFPIILLFHSRLQFVQ